MLDNLRDSADSSSFYEEDPNDLYREPASKPAPVGKRTRRRSVGFLGMTALQRLILAVMLLFTTCALGTLAMVLMGKMSLI